MFALRGVLSEALCGELIRDVELDGFEDAPITTSAGAVMRPDVRNNKRVMRDDPDRAAELWDLVRAEIPKRVIGAPPPNDDPWEPIGLNERLRFYRYTAGQKFDWHFDGSFVRGPKERSLLSILFYLNDGFEGGETALNFFDSRPRLVEFKPITGDVLVFLHRVYHTGAAVRSGVKYVMRSDVMFRTGVRANGD